MPPIFVRMPKPWSLHKLEWESGFFNRPLYRLELLPDFQSTDWSALESSLGELPSSALCEATVDSLCISHVGLLEDAGFRLCDSKFQFLTKVHASALPPCPNTLAEGHHVRSYLPKDLDAILELTEAQIAQNPKLITKFKSKWFPPDAASRWYRSWMEDVLRRGALCSVLVGKEDNVLGFFAYQEKEAIGGVRLFKGILAAIEPQARGGKGHLAMQDHLFRTAFEASEFWLDNTTQISNPAVFKNHFHSGRRPHQIQLIFLKGEPHQS